MEYALEWVANGKSTVTLYTGNIQGVFGRMIVGDRQWEYNTIDQSWYSDLALWNGERGRFVVVAL